MDGRGWPGDDHGPLPRIVVRGSQARVSFFEAVTPVRRAALLTVDRSPTVAANLARLDRVLRRQVVELFPRLDARTLEAVDALTSWDAWNRLRTAQGLSAAAARRVLEQTIRKLIEETT